MKKYIFVTVDTNDADYVSSKTEITDEQIAQIMPVIDLLKLRAEIYKDTGDWKYRANWECGECQDSKTPEKLYVKTGLLTQDMVDMFFTFLPYVEEGFHTIEEISIVVETENLFKLD